MALQPPNVKRRGRRLQVLPLTDLLTCADIFSVHVPLDESARNLVDPSTAGEAPPTSAPLSETLPPRHNHYFSAMNRGRARTVAARHAALPLSEGT